MQKLQIKDLKEQLNGGRLETGSLKVNSDWKGVFIRNEDAVQHYMHLNMLLESLAGKKDDPFLAHLLLEVESLNETLKKAIFPSSPNLQKI